ncbi:SDR family NAD(P)-dependent oxidoreductase [Nocardioides immobilis]|uniref:SDR family NAD(P)-dependent oxidoreductase n=1 Tax=Nocardioides immobilis TaxID=2049295 RepID=A0A417Y1Q5_9ACTN|nr:NAD(P)H-binding protein [Nocardioides immobilis]RHW26599.1 SDR family NAD(P)-dependent oxidoreductase [Nocardioides immobilis]
MIAITGATGALGGQVARLLADQSPTLVVRDPSRAPDVGGEVRQASYDDRAAAELALAGVDTLLLVSAAESATRRQQHRTMVEAAAAAGVRHLVYTSFVGAGADATFTLGRDHGDTEQAIRDAAARSGMTYTLLRDNFYADVLPWFADASGVIRGPAGDGRVAAVARADVAGVAAAVLLAPEAHAGAIYELTGPEALTMAEVAARAGAAVGRELRYEEETIEEAYASRRAGYPDAADFELDAWVSTYTAIADGSVATVTNDVEKVTGRPARTLEEALRP